MMDTMAFIIVVEDDLAQQEELVDFLKLSGFEVKGAESGEALDLCLEQFTPDIVLLDYNLPDSRGLDLVLHLRKRFGLSLGIIMITARGHSSDRIECRRAGADGYLVKPIEFLEMLATIDNLVKRIPLHGAVNDVWSLNIRKFEIHSPNGTTIHLSAIEVNILCELASDEHHHASRETLIRAIGKDPASYDPRALEAIISRLRGKFLQERHNSESQDTRNPLQAVRGSGYKFLHRLIARQ